MGRGSDPSGRLSLCCAVRSDLCCDGRLDPDDRALRLEEHTLGDGTHEEFADGGASSHAEDEEFGGGVVGRVDEVVGVGAVGFVPRDAVVDAGCVRFLLAECSSAPKLGFEALSPSAITTRSVARMRASANPNARAPRPSIVGT